MMTRAAAPAAVTASLAVTKATAVAVYQCSTCSSSCSSSCSRAYVWQTVLDKSNTGCSWLLLQRAAAVATCARRMCLHIVEKLCSPFTLSHFHTDDMSNWVERDNNGELKTTTCVCQTKQITMPFVQIAHMKPSYCIVAAALVALH
eukprot:15792-Heterococcus_DN1.PRE.8